MLDFPEISLGSLLDTKFNRDVYPYIFTPFYLSTLPYSHLVVPLPPYTPYTPSTCLPILISISLGRSEWR